MKVRSELDTISSPQFVKQTEWRHHWMAIRYCDNYCACKSSHTCEARNRVRRRAGTQTHRTACSTRKPRTWKAWRKTQWKYILQEENNLI